MKSTKDISIFVVGLLILFVFNSVISTITKRWDMTSSGVYTLSPKNIEIIKSAKGRIVATLFLSDDVPATFKKLKSDTEYFLSSLHSINDNVWYDVFDPTQGNIEQRKAISQIFRENNVNPNNIRVNTVDGMTETKVYPYIHLESMHGELYINILEDKRPNETEEDAIYRSIQKLESKVSKGIYQLGSGGKPHLGIVAFDELIKRDLYNLTRALNKNYSTSILSPIDLFENRDSVPGALITISPDITVAKDDLLMIDQYVMSGGQVLWLIDEYEVALDSINNYKEYLPAYEPSSVSDYLFYNGAKLSGTWISDWRSSRIPQVVGERAGRAQTEMFNYPFHPVMVGTEHAISQNLNEINLNYPTKIEVVSTSEDIELTPLLVSSEYSKSISYPNIFTFEIVRNEPNLVDYNEMKLSPAVLIEGKFTSYFSNRMSSTQKRQWETKHGEIKSKSENSNSQIVITDQKFALPSITPQGQPLPIGFNKWERRVFRDNEVFLNNAIEYLINGDEFLVPDERSDYVLAALDKRKVAEMGKLWSMINLIFAPILLLLVHILFVVYLKRKYA